nr:WbuC family cupin fold metalloprotein [uncultured Deefgea sp.]
MSTTTFIDQALLSGLLDEAAQSPRFRKNRNFHADDAASCHRLLNALQPDTYVQPHCHFSPEKEETMVVLSGRMGVLIFNKDGMVISQQVVAAGTDCIGVNIPSGVIHSLVALEPTVFFEAKAGPYVPVADNERAKWAPSEGDAAVEIYREWMRSLFD